MIVLPLLYDVEKWIHNLMVLVMDKDNYKVCYHAKLPTTTKPAVYDNGIPNNVTNLVRSKVEAVHTDNISD